MTKPVIRLYDLAGTGLIFPWPSGVIYSNQTGGLHCLQPEVEGIFVPVGNDILAEDKLFSHAGGLLRYFWQGHWKGRGAVDGLVEGDADFIDHLLRKPPILSYIRVDRDRLLESHEAWVNVIVDRDDKGVPSLFPGLEPSPCKAILTWPNSD